MKQVLFIDDSEDNLNLYKVYFKKSENLTAHFLSNQEEAIEFAKSNNMNFIFLDIQMPGMDGFEVYQKLQERNIDSKVIALTGFTDTETIKRIEEAKFDSYLKKPILKKDLLAFINNG